MSEPSETAVKSLCAMSRNLCFYEGCERTLSRVRPIEPVRAARSEAHRSWRSPLGDFLLHRWLPAKGTTLRPSAYDSYRRNIELHIVPAIGHVKLQQLSANQLDRSTPTSWRVGG